MTEINKIQQKISYLKKENQILKDLLKKVNKMDLYIIDYDYDINDELVEYPELFNLKDIIQDSIYEEKDNEKRQIKKNIRSYIK